MGNLAYAASVVTPALLLAMVVVLVVRREWRAVESWAWLVFSLSAVVAIAFPSVLDSWRDATGIGIPRELPAFVCVAAAAVIFFARRSSGKASE